MPNETRCQRRSCPNITTHPTTVLVSSYGDSSLYCESCTVEYTFHCSNCARTVHTSMERHSVFGGAVVCGTCLESSFTACADCHIYARYRGDNCLISRNNHYYCLTCIPRHPVIVQVRGSRGNRAEQAFPFMGEPKDGVFMGVELETSAAQDGPAIALKVHELVKDFAIIKDDGSVDGYAMEIVSAPMSYELQLEKWVPLLDGHPPELVSWKAPRQCCGMHVHVTKKALKTLQIAKISVFLNEPANEKLITHIAGRYGNASYCHMSKKDIKTAHIAESSRYTALNLLNDATVEFRIFRGTLRKHCFLKNIEFVDSMVKWAKDDNPGHIAQDHYLDFLMQSGERYPNLIQSLKKAGFFDTPAAKPTTIKTTGMIPVAA